MNFSVQVWIHEMDSPTQGKFLCWSFISEGLREVKQPEIVFMVRQRRNEHDEDYPLAPLAWIRIVYLLACKSSHLDTFQPCKITFGQSVQIDINKFMITEDLNQWADFRRFGMLIHGIRCGGIPNLPDSATPQGCHFVIGLTPNEAGVAEKHSLYRPISQTGIAARFFPFPMWLDRDRADACTLADQKGSFLATSGLYPVRIPGINVRHLKDQIVLTIPEGEEKRKLFCGEVQDNVVTDALCLESSMSEEATSGYLWSPGQKLPHVYGRLEAELQK